MPRLYRINPTVEGFRFICEKAISELYVRKCDLENHVRDYENGDLQIWTADNIGFLLISFEITDKSKFLNLQIVKGRKMFSYTMMSLLEELAKAEKCEFIQMETVKPVVVTAAKKLGFKYYGTIEYYGIRMRRYL